jgi:hypothetical protein
MTTSVVGSESSADFRSTIVVTDPPLALLTLRLDGRRPGDDCCSRPEPGLGLFSSEDERPDSGWRALETPARADPDGVVVDGAGAAVAVLR